MDRVTQLPVAFDRFRACGGAIDFAVFGESDGSDDDIVQAVRTALPASATFDENVLRRSGYRWSNKREVLGDWYDRVTGALLKIGEWSTEDGTTLRDPPLNRLTRAELVSGAFEVPAIGSQGQFAYAFSSPPYALSSSPSDTQAMFDAVLSYILPPGTRRNEVKDWTSTNLSQVSDYFTAGSEWWGVFLFSFYVPDLQRLTIALASSSD